VSAASVPLIVSVVISLLSYSYCNFLLGLMAF
jgi:hypothetical protein